MTGRQLVAEHAAQLLSSLTDAQGLPRVRFVFAGYRVTNRSQGAWSNWGRVLSAVGTTDAVFEPDALNVSMNGIQICQNGSIGQDRKLVDLEPREVLVEIDLQAGGAEATIWTNDLTHEYVHENSAYSSWIRQPPLERTAA